ncbi:hypothetical protein G9A89_023690 [Geosiphon pyriformis]|nr:hypothetical protein G9A89_023690 [Geosiphon pyriformis]
MPCDDKWCPECYALSIPLPSENDQEEIEFGKPETKEKIATTPIYLTKNQPAIQLKYFDNNGKGIKPEKAHEIDAGYNLRYPDKDTLILQPKSLTKINLKITLEIPLRAIVQIASKLSLASKEINIEHAEKIAQAIYLPLINILGLQSVNNREQVGKSERGMQDFVPVNIALNIQNKSHQILQLPQPITISPFGEHHEIYTCSKPTTTQQIFESNEQIFIFYNPNNYPIVLLNKLEIGIIYSNIFQDENPQIVSNFIEIVKHTLLPNPNIIFTTENYHLLEEKLSQINMGSLEPQQQRQLKQLIAEFADIFAKDNNDLGKTDIVQHQIHIGDAPPKHQQAY